MFKLSSLQEIPVATTKEFEFVQR